MNTSTTPLAFIAAWVAKRETLKNRIARYTAYIEQDKAIISSSKYPQKYESRLRNHTAKLERARASLQRIEETLDKEGI